MIQVIAVEKLNGCRLVQFVAHDTSVARRRGIYCNIEGLEEEALVVVFTL